MSRRSGQRATRSVLRRGLLALLGLSAFAGFVALGNWQLERRVWKLDLIERVEARVHAPAEMAPGPAQWAEVSRDRDEYRHVRVAGRFLPDRNVRVTAATDLGSGYWVLSPLQRPDGTLVLINRGFVAQGAEPAPVPAGQVTVEGLLRLSEPGGGVLRDNRPEAGRWYSRDVAAISRAEGLDALAGVAPYFIDAAEGARGSPGGDGPVGGLTVVRFHNSHLVYALTWYGLAAMVLGAAWLVVREERRRGAK